MTRILTTQCGSLPRPQELLDMYVAEELPATYPGRLHEAVGDVVRKQAETGIDIVSDGEFGKPTQTNKAGYGHLAWALYVHDRLEGFEIADAPYAGTPSKDRSRFRSFYGADLFPGTGRKTVERWTCTGPVRYVGADAVQRDIDNLIAAMDAAGLGRGFLPAVSPGIISGLFPNAYYPTQDEYEAAIAEAMRHEYAAIAAAGLEVQIDDPEISDWDTTEASLDEFRRSMMRSIECLNHALSGVPRDLVRYHICWGGWISPHSSDLPLVDMIDVLLGIEAEKFSFEAANPRHEHEWRVWEQTQLPDGITLLPGVVSHKSAILEHPELVAERILRFAGIVGPENVIASTDCGMGGRIDPELAWAKLSSLVEGAEIAASRIDRMSGRHRHPAGNVRSSLRPSM